MSTSDRCHGTTTHALCALRETCARWDAKPRRDVFYLHPQVPGPCVYYKPKTEGESNGRE